MSEKFSIRDIFIYIIPGSIWLVNLYLIIQLFNLDTIISIYINNKILEVATLSWSFIVLAYISGLLLSSITIDFFRIFTRKKYNETKKDYADYIKSHYLGTYDYEFIDDFLRLQNMENTWRRYRDLEMIIKHTFIPIFIVIILLTIKFACTYSYIKVIIVGIIAIITFVSLAINKISYLRKQRLKELDRILVIWYYNLQIKESKESTKLEDVMKFSCNK